MCIRDRAKEASGEIDESIDIVIGNNKKKDLIQILDAFYEEKPVSYTHLCKSQSQSGKTSDHIFYRTSGNLKYDALSGGGRRISSDPVSYTHLADHSCEKSKCEEEMYV